MSGDRHSRVKELFLEACGLPPEERAAFVRNACGDDGELRAEVESLLGYHEEPGKELPRFPAPTDPTIVAGEALSMRIGPYRLLEKIGEGGMGEVYVAEQEQPVHRRVAIKLIKWGLDSKEVLARFQAERQALALMNHPNIARVYEAGTTERGQPYFVMEYVEGQPLTAFCDERCLDTRRRLDIFLQICEGVQHAHQKGVIHRDLKPSNILIHLENDEPVPKIIDFGVAKATQQRLTEKTLYTAMGMLIGTPDYMSPEQAELTGLDVDTRTDVYSLGVLLYELLVGVLPFEPTDLRRAGFDEIRRRIREVEPSKPSTRLTTLGDRSTDTAQLRRTDPLTLSREIRGDLDWITMKALEKDRTRRYTSAGDLAADVRRHLAHEPVLAGPPGALYRFGKFVRRHRVGVTAGAIVLLALLAGIVGTTLGLVRAHREAETARKVSRILEQVFQDLDPATFAGHARSPDEIMDRAARRIEAELSDVPRVRARVFRTMGRASVVLGSYERAREMLEKSLAIEREQLGDDHPDVALTQSLLGDLLYEMGRYDEARVSQERALETRRRTLGEKDVAVGWSLRALGSIHWRMGEFDEARAYFRQALAILEQVQGIRRVDIASTLVSLSLVEMDFGETKSARDHLERALEIKEEILGSDHFEVGVIVAELGRSHLLEDRPETARPYLERALEIHESALGPESPAVAFPLTSLGIALYETGDYAKAEARLRRALEVREAVLGHDHPSLAWSLRPLGRIALDRNDHVTARRYFSRALEIVEQAFGNDHPEVARSLSAIGELERRSGKLAEARRYHERSLAIRRAIYGPCHLAVSVAQYDLARLEALEGKKDQALATLREAVRCGHDPGDLRSEPDFASLRGSPSFEQLADPER